MAEWYYARNDQQHGPISDKDLKQMAQAGELFPTDNIWKQGMAQWVPAARVKGLFATAGSSESQQPVQSPAPEPVYASREVEPAAAPMDDLPLAYASPSGDPVAASAQSVEMLRQTKPWVRLIAILLFIGAGLILLGALVILIAAAAFGSKSSLAGAPIAMIAFLYIGLAFLYIVPAVFLNRYASRINDVMNRNRNIDFEAALQAQKSFWKFVGITTLVVIGLYLIFLLFAIGTGFKRF